MVISEAVMFSSRSLTAMASGQENREELDRMAHEGETVILGGTGVKSLEAQEHLAEDGMVDRSMERCAMHCVDLPFPTRPPPSTGGDAAIEIPLRQDSSSSRLCSNKTKQVTPANVDELAAAKASMVYQWTSRWYRARFPLAVNQEKKNY
ncbi:hypothetical protein ACP4OV_008550 [Aristida adscensionis]